jgi:DNA-binding CsgD family transcriptional regulator
LPLAGATKKVAETLAISVRTVETHRAKIMLKPGIHSIGELVRYAVRNGLIDA